jgi:hypothetical protein
MSSARVGLDHLILEAVERYVVLLQQGCLCCTLNGSLSANPGGTRYAPFERHRAAVG